MSEPDLFETIAAGLVEELTRRGVSAYSCPPQGTISHWFLRSGPCFIALHDEYLLYFNNNESFTKIRYEDPDMIEQLIAAIVS